MDKPSSNRSRSTSRSDRETAPDELVDRPKFAQIPSFGVVVMESRHAPGFLGRLKDPFAKFHLIIAGHARWEGSGRVFHVGPDTLFHIAPHVAHQQQDLPNDPVTLYAVHYRPELLSVTLTHELSQAGMLPLDLGSAHIDQSRQVRSIFQEMLFEQATRQAGWEMVLQARLMDLAVLTMRLTRRLSSAQPVFVRGGDSVERVANYASRLKSRFYLRETLEEASQAVSLSRRQFTALFRQVTGVSWRKYIQRLRLEHAVKLLTETDQSVTAVAFECGFDDLSHFHHSFKEAHGCSPAAYREKKR